MLRTLIHKPNGPLKDLVLFIAIREFDCFQEDFFKPMHAKHEIHMMFMINCKMHDFINVATNQKVYSIKKRSTPDCTFSGLLTSLKGSILFKGQIQLLVIHFKPTGFYHVFGIPPAEITDCLGNSDELFLKDVLQLHEQLHEAKSHMEMFQLTEKLLLKNLQEEKNRIKGASLEKATECMLNQPDTYSIEELAYHSNLTLKTFERKFREQVGISPKLFARIRRFNQAMDLKTYQPNLTWMDISVQTGYYDPMHLVKDFKKFAALSPSNLFKNAPPLYEDISIYPIEG